MGSNGASGGSADAPNTTRSTLSTKNQAKADKKSRAEANVEVGLGKTKTQRAFEKVGNFVKTGGTIGAVVRGVTKSVRRGRVNTSLMGTSDYQGSSTRSSVTNSINDGRDNNNNGNQVVQAPKVISPTTAEVSQSSISATPEVTLKKRRGRGRSLMIATSPEGVKDQSLTLSQKTLLG